MSTIIHINKRQVPGKCGADPSKPNYRGCPFTRHFGSMEEYEEYVEQQDAIIKGDKPVPPLPKSLTLLEKAVTFDNNPYGDLFGRFTLKDFTKEDQRQIVDALSRIHMRLEVTEFAGTVDNAGGDARVQVIENLIERIETMGGINGEAALLLTGILKDEQMISEAGHFPDEAGKYGYTAKYLNYLQNVPYPPLEKTFIPKRAKDWEMVDYIGPHERLAYARLLQFNEEPEGAVDYHLLRLIKSISPEGDQGVDEYRIMHRNKEFATVRERLDTEVVQENNQTESKLRALVQYNKNRVKDNEALLKLDEYLSEVDNMNWRVINYLEFQLAKRDDLETPPSDFKAI